MFVLARGLQSGSRAAVAGAAGCATGAYAYVVATAVGLAALLASSHLVFAAVHYAGAAYLCWLGIAALRSRAPEAPVTAGPRSPWRSYRQGVVVELGNPKVALFFLALFPQFIHPDAGPAAVQVLILGTLFVSIGMASDSRLRSRLRPPARAARAPAEALPPPAARDRAGLPRPRRLGGGLGLGLGSR